MYSKVPLLGQELEEYLQKERAEKEKEAAQKVANARSQRMLEADEDDEDESDSDNDDSDEENEVERALGGGGDSMDTTEDHAPDGIVIRKKKGGGGVGGGGGGDDWGGLDAADDGLSKHLSFDIYLKGNVSRTTSFFKTADGQTQRFRMFPYIEKKRKVDEYGETIDVGMWLRSSKAFEEAENEENRDKKGHVEDDTKVCLYIIALFPRCLTDPLLSESCSGSSFKICYLGYRGSIGLSTIVR
jgi:cleavage and polyadenylation specificity factor subunit 2